MQSLLVLLCFLLASTCFGREMTSFVKIPGVGSYRLFTEPLDWKSAYIECYLQDAHLAVLNNRIEARIVKALIEKTFGPKSPTSVITGFHSMFSERHWVTIFGHPLHSVYEAWGRYQPDNFGAIEWCGAINGVGLMEDIPCVNYEYPYICEKFQK